jgi:DNA invertase Pin-like site-specific DNA recombinase
MKKYVVYLRYWPKKRNSAIHPDLPTQKSEAARFISYNEGRIVGEYTEKEERWPDPQDARPELKKAIEHAIRSEVTLVIPFLGRLARSVPVTQMLLQASGKGLSFRCLDYHDMHDRTIHILANMAGEESRKASHRIKNALAGAQERGVKLGSSRPGHWEGREHRRGTKKAIAAAAKKKKARTRNTYAFLMPEIKTRRERGETLPEIVDWLNRQGHKTTAGKPFTQTAVWRLIDRYLGKELLGNNTRKFKAVS